MFLWKNGTLGDFYSLLVVDWLVCDCRGGVGVRRGGGGAYGEDYGLGFCGGTCLEV